MDSLRTHAAAIRGALAAALLALLAVGLAARADLAPEPPFTPKAAAAGAKGRPWVLFVEVTGSINPGSSAHWLEALKDAEEQGAEALVVRLDTPGGLLNATRDVVQAMLSSKVPVVVWVGPPGARAGSAGVFLTLAANVAAMAPSTNIGAAHPVGIGGTGKKADKEEKDDKGADDVMAQKIENDTAAFVTGIAERRQRNVEWAEKAVRESVAIVASKALELKVIDLIAEDVPELLQKIDGRTVALSPADKRVLRTAGAELRPARWAVKNRVLNFLADPEIAYLIGMLGVLGILAELYHPGGIVPGVVGVICLLIAAVSFQMIPVNAGALALLGLGIVLFGLELFVGGHGGFVAAGAVCVVVGSLLLVGHVGGGFWADRDYGLGWRVVAPVGLALCVIAFTLVSKIGRTAGQPLLSGAPGLVGMVGEVREEIGGGAPGRVMVNGELWTARSATPLEPGRRAKVVSVDGLTVLVEPEAGKG